MKSVAILVAPGFEEIEFSTPLDILRRWETHDLSVKMDTTLAGFNKNDFRRVILPGYPSAYN